GAQLLELGGVSPGHLGQAAGGVGEPGEDLVALPFGVGAQLAGLAGGVFTNPGGLCACVLGPCLGGGGALVSLRGPCEGLVASVVSGADEGLRLGHGPLDRLPCLRLGAACALRGFSDGGGLVRLGCGDPLVSVGARSADGFIGFPPDGLPGFLVLDNPVPEFGPCRTGVSAGS